MRWVQLVIFIVFLSGLVEGVSAVPTATLTSSSTVNLKTGESTTATISVFNDNSFCTVTAYYSIDSSSYNNLIGRIQPKVSKSINIEVPAPPIGTGSGSIQREIYVKIVADNSTWCGGEIYYRQLVLNINCDDSEFQNTKSNAGSAISSANSAINSASSSIAAAQNIINAAKNNGADVSNAEVKLTGAQTTYQNSQSKFGGAQNNLNQNTKQSFDLAAQYANEATNYANSAKADADSAYSIAVQANQIAQAAKDSASMAITGAKKVIDSATASKAEAQNVINDAKNKGSDIGSAQALLDTVVSKLNSASSKYNEANSYFNNKKWNDAKTTADDAKTYANDALNNAGLAKSTAIQAKPVSPKTSVSIDLHGEKTNVVLDEDILLKLSAVNYISMPEMHVQVIIKPPSGMGVTSSEFSISGAGQYTANYKLLPGEGKDIEVRIRPNQVGDFNVKGTVIYYFGDEKENYEEKSVNLPITVRKGNSNIQNEISPSQQQISGFGLIIGIIGLLFAILYTKVFTKE